MTPDQITDEHLVAFLDGALDGAKHAAVAAALAGDANLRARLAALDLNLSALRDGFEAVLADAPPLEIAVPPTPAIWRPIHAAAAAAMLAIGFGLGWSGTQLGQPDPWHQAVANYQVLYTTQTLTATPLPPAAQEAGLRAVSAEIGLDLSKEALAVEGLDFQRAQILSHEGAPLIQVAYLTEDGAPVAFCFMRGQAVSDPEATTLSGLNASTWARAGYTFILIGPVDEAVLARAAQTLRDRLPG